LSTISVNQKILKSLRIIDGIAQQQVGSIVNIQSETVHDITTFDVDTSVDQVATNTVSLSVNSVLPQGKVIAIKVNKDVMKDLNLKVLVDNGNIPAAIDLNDLFKVDTLKYLLVIGQEVEILVSVPHFSEHQITVTSAQAATAVATTSASEITAVPTVTTATANSAVTETPTVTTTLPQATPPTAIPVYTLLLILTVVVIVMLLYILIIKRK
jgi:hypothetical protein